MTINSWGYEGSIMPNVDWALMQYALGHQYFVLDDASVKVTPAGDGTREVDISPGFFGGQGILDQNDASVRLQLPTVASGTNYFMIVARRTWGATQATTFDFIDAGTGATLPVRNVSPGTLDDQPLALVPVVAGNTVPGNPIDLRAIGHSKGGPYFANSNLVLAYLDRVGTVVQIGNETWTRGLASWASAGSDVVRLSGDQTVAGKKTFTTAPAVPANAFPISAVSGLQGQLNAINAAIPFASRYKTNDTSIPNNDWRSVSLNASASGAVAITWSDPNFVVSRAGHYLITAGVRFDANGSGNRGLGIVRNDGTILVRVIQPASSSGAFSLTASKIVALSQGQSVHLEAYQSSGGTLKVEGTAGSAVERSNYLDIAYIGL